MPEAGAVQPTLSLSARLAIGIGGLLAIVGVVLAVAVFAYGRAAARDAFDRLLVGAANDIASSVSIVDGRPEVDLPVSAFALLALAPDDRIAYGVRGPDGALLTGYDDLPAAPRGGRDERGAQFYDATFGGEDARYIRVVRRFAERQVSGTVEVVVGQTLRARRELAFDITSRALIALALGGLPILVLAIVVLRRALAPLDRLAAALSARDPQDLTPIDARVPGEVAVMVTAMNGFMGRLDRQFAAMRGLISDAAHQLRTPVAALRAQADLAQQEQDPQRQRDIVQRIHRRSLGLGRLLDQMLSRALVTHRIEAARREAIDLRDIALEIVDSGDHRLIAPGAEVRLEIGETPVIVMGDALSLGEAARNLLNNALAHGGSPITVGAGHEDGAAMLWVEDAGSGPPAEVRERLGARFQRGATQGSAGLGLSIAREVAEAYSGELVTDDTPGGFRIGLRFGGGGWVR